VIYIYLFLVLANILFFAFGPWCFILVLEKLVHVEIGRNIHFSSYFEELKPNILHITASGSNMNKFCRD